MTEAVLLRAEVIELFEQVLQAQQRPHPLVERVFVQDVLGLRHRRRGKIGIRRYHTALRPLPGLAYSECKRRARCASASRLSPLKTTSSASASRCSPLACAATIASTSARARLPRRPTRATSRPTGASTPRHGAHTWLAAGS